MSCHWPLLVAALAAIAFTPPVSAVYVPLSNSFPYEVGDIKHFLVLFMENRAFGEFTVLFVGVREAVLQQTRTTLARQHRNCWQCPPRIMPHQPPAQQGIRLHTDLHLRYTCCPQLVCASISAATNSTTHHTHRRAASSPLLSSLTRIPPPDHIFGCSADELPGIDGVKPGIR